MRRLFTQLIHELGLHQLGAFYRDGWVGLAAVAASGFWLLLWLCLPVQPISWQQLGSGRFLLLTLWQPVLEELLFRGVLQGQCLQYRWGQRTRCGVTAANGVTALIFAIGHAWSHPPLWAAAVLLPSLVFGAVRDRCASLYPAMALHVWYNTGYFVLTGLP